MRAVDDFGSSSARGGDWKDMLIRAADKVKKRQDEDRKRYREDSTPAGQARRFFDSESGQRFLNADGKMDRKSAYTDPIRYLVAHPDYTQWLSLAYGSKATPETANSAVENLKRLGVPDDVIRETASYLESEKGAKNYRPAGARDYGGPVFNITKGLTGSTLAAGIASAIVDAATYGAESGMAPGTDRVGGELAADLAGAVGNKLLLGRGINKLEDKAAEAAARKAGGKAAAKFGAKLGTRVGLNLAEDVPLSAAQMIAYGMDPKSSEFRKALAFQAATSGGSAAAVTSARPALRLASRFPATPEVAGALTGYGAAKATGQDEETARVAALAGAGAASVRRRGVFDTINKPAEMLARLQGREGKAPALGLGIEETGDTDHFVRSRVFRPNDPHPPGGYVPGDQMIVGGNRPRQTLGDDGIWHPAPYTGPRPGVENAANLLGGRQIAGGKKALIGRIEMEARRGTSRKGLQGEGLDRGAADAAVQFVEALPDHYTEVLGSSFVTRPLSEGDGTDRVAGQYDPSTALITISKRLTNGSSDPERVIVHEVAHHLDRFVNQADHDALVQQWQREMGNPGIMPGSGQGGEALRRAQPVLQKLEEQEALRENLRGSRRQATPEEQALLSWSPTPEEYALLGGLYRWQGGFPEWFAENIADRALRDQQTPAVRSAFDRVREHIKSLLLGAYNFLLRRGERDAAERVYQNLLAGKYDTLDAREMEADARLNMEADPAPMAPNDSNKPRIRYGTSGNMTVAHVWMPDAATQVTVDAEVGGARRSEAEILADAQARIARLGGAEYLRANPIGTGAPPPPARPPAPPAAPPPPEPEPPRMTPEESAEVDDIIERARVLTDTPRIAESILRKLLPGGLKKAALMANPAALLSTAAGKAVLTATVARENARRLYTDVWGRERSRRVNDVLAPLMRDTGPRLGPVSLQDVGRAGLEAAPPLAAYGVGEALGLENNEKKQLAITGLMGTAAISHSINRGNLRKTPWMSAVYLAEKEDRPKFLRKGYGLLLDIIERPDQYDLSKLPPEAGTALDALQEMRQSWVAEVNAQRLDAGLPPITLRDANRMYHLWSGRPFEDVETPPSERGYTVGRIYGSGLQREMGDTFFEAMTNNPKLRVAAGGDPRAILREQLRELASMRADAIFVKALKGNPEAAVQSVNVDELRQRRDAARAAGDEVTADSLSGRITNALSQEKTYRSQGWQKVPGFGDNYFFSPDAIKAINDIFVDGREVGGAFMRLMDAGTSEIRQAAFVADASAWSLQGLMLAFQSPSTVLSNIPELMAASVFGTRFTDWWMRNNSALVEEFHKSGGILARETEGTEKRVRTLGDVPGIRNIESRGFDAYLPIHRIKLFKHQKDIGSLVQRTGMTKLGADLPVGAITAAKYAAGGAAAYGILDSDQGDFEKMVELAILGLGSSYAARIGEGKAGKAAFSGLNPTAQRKVGIRAAKDVNRMSGVYNKAALGITNEQAQFERVFAARSPAIVRNMLTMLKLAATNPGLEGATARFYLARTVLFTAAGLGALKMSMGQDESWDPDDPNSVLNPSSGFLRANLQVAGKVAPSNPYISLFRAVLKTEDVEGGKPGEFRTLRSSLQGVAENFLGRAPDISGKVYQGAYNQLAPELGVKPTDYSSGEPMGATGLLKAAAGSFVPVTARDLYKTGVLPSPWFGMDPPKPDPNYNTTMERVLGSIVPALGGNYSPETRSQEASRTEAAQVAEQFPGTTDVNANGRIDRRDLNDMDREKFDTGQPGKDLNAFKEETRGLMPDRPESDLDRYYARLSGARDTHVQKLKDLEQAVASGEISKLEWRKAYQAEQSRYVEEKKTVDKDFTATPLTNEDGSERLIKDESGKARTMNVVEYARRSVHPEDDAVDGYFKLFDQAIGPDGKINFEKLDSLRTEFHSSLPPEVQSYVDQRLAAMAEKGVTDSEGNDVPLPTLSEYDRVKEMAKPYWEVEDKHFADLQQRDAFFKQFPKYSDYKDAVTAFATETGLSTAQVEAAIARKHRALTRFNKTVTKDKRAMRGSNTDLDIGLKDFYGLEEVNPYAYIARKGGDTSYDNLGPSLARRSQAPSSRRIMRFAQERGRAGTAEAVSSFRRTFLS